MLLLLLAYVFDILRIDVYCHYFLMILVLPLQLLLLLLTFATAIGVVVAVVVVPLPFIYIFHVFFQCSACQRLFLEVS